MGDIVKHEKRIDAQRDYKIRIYTMDPDLHSAYLPPWGSPGYYRLQV